MASVGGRSITILSQVADKRLDYLLAPTVGWGGPSQSRGHAKRPALSPHGSFVFPTCSGGDARPLPDSPNQTADTGRASGHAPRRAGPEPGDAALAGRGRGRHHDGNHHHPPATPGKAQRLTWRYGTPTAMTLRTHGPKGRSGGAAGDCRPDHNLGAASSTLHMTCSIIIIIIRLKFNL